MTASSTLISGVQRAYDATAGDYDRWPWQSLWRRREFPIVLNALSKAFERPSVLDLGCGTGAFASTLMGRISRFVGIDTSRRMVEMARRRKMEVSRFVEGDMLGESIDEEPFDAVVSLRAASHCQEVSRLVWRARSSLSPGGLFILSDVAAEHRYEETRLPSAGGKILVPTFKHAPEQVARLLQHEHGFRLESVVELRADGCEDTLTPRCRSIDASGRIPFGRIFVARAV